MPCQQTLASWIFYDTLSIYPYLTYIMPLKRKFNLINLGSWAIRKKKKNGDISSGGANLEKENVCICNTTVRASYLQIVIR